MSQLFDAPVRPRGGGGSANRKESTLRWRARNPEKVAATYERRRDSGRDKIYKSRHRKLHPESGWRYKDAKRLPLDVYKVTVGCSDCGYRGYPEALDFDHLPGTVKLFNVGARYFAPLDLLIAELEKCEVVCANCHRHRTRTRSRAWRERKS